MEVPCESDPKIPEDQYREFLTLVMKHSTEMAEFLERKIKDPHLARPEVIVSMTLEFLFSALSSVAYKIEKYPQSDKDLVIKCENFHDAFEKLKYRWKDVNTLKNEIAKDWECPECKNVIIKYVKVSGVRRRPLRFLAICRVCEYESQISGNGLKILMEHYGDLSRGPWNPKANGFIYMGD